MPVIPAPPPLATDTRPGLVGTGAQNLAGNKTLFGTLTVEGVVRSNTGGFTFPDGTTQTTAYVPGTGLTGSGQVNQVTFWTNVGTIGGSDNLQWVEANGLGVGGVAASGVRLHVFGLTRTTDQIQAPSGTATAPAFAFPLNSSNAAMGFFKGTVTENDLCVATNGTHNWTFRGTYILPASNAAQTIGYNGTVLSGVYTISLRDSNGIFRWHANTPGNNIYRSATADGATAISHAFYNTIALTTAGAKVASFYSDDGTTEVSYIDLAGRNYSGPGTQALPGISFTNDTNSGFYRAAEDQINVSLGGSARFALTTNRIVPASSTGYSLGQTDLGWENLYVKNHYDAGAAGNTNLRLVFTRDSGSTYRGAVPDGATAVAHSFRNSVALTTAGAKIANWYSDDGTTEQAYLTRDGVFRSKGVWPVSPGQNLGDTSATWQFLFLGATVYDSAGSQRITGFGAGSNMGFLAKGIDGASAVAFTYNTSGAAWTLGKLVSWTTNSIERASITAVGQGYFAGGIRFGDGTTQTTAATGGGSSFSGVLEGSSTGPIQLKARNTNTAGFAQVTATNDNNDNGFLVIQSIGSTYSGLASQARLVAGSAMSSLYITTAGNAPIMIRTSDTDRIRIAGSSGNVGIGTGTNDATQKLEVAGTIYSNTGGFRFPDNTTQTTASVWNGITYSAAGAGNSAINLSITNTDWTGFSQVGPRNSSTNGHFVMQSIGTNYSYAPFQGRARLVAGGDIAETQFVLDNNSAYFSWLHGTTERMRLTSAGLTVAGVAMFGDGAEATPGIRFSSEATGLYRPAASQLGFTVAGTGEMLMTGTAFYPLSNGGFSMGANNQAFNRVYTHAIRDSTNERLTCANSTGNIYISRAAAATAAHEFRNTAATSTGRVISVFTDNGTTEVLAVDSGGRLRLTYSDSTGNPDNSVVQSTNIGRTLVMSGTTSVMVINTLCTATSVVTIVPEDAAGYTASVVPAAGSFTVTLSGTPAANWIFRWSLLQSLA